MRHVHRIWVVTWATFGSALGQTSPSEPPAAVAAVTETAPDTATAHDELRALQAVMEQALNKGDLEGLLAHVDDDVVFTAMNAAVGRGKQGISDYFNEMMVGPDKIVESVSMDLVPDGLSRFYGPDMAVSTGSAPSRYVLTNGLDFEVDGRWTATLVRKQGRWLVATFHYSTDVFNNPVLDLQRKWLLIAAGVFSLLLAAVAYFVGRRSGRTVRPAA